MKTRIFFLAILFSFAGFVNSFAQTTLKVFNNSNTKTYVSIQYYSNGVFKTAKSTGQIAPRSGDKITLAANPKSIKVSASYDKNGTMTSFYNDYVADGTVSISFAGNPPTLKARQGKPTLSQNHSPDPAPTTSNAYATLPRKVQDIHVSVNNRSDWDVQFRYVYDNNTKSDWYRTKGKASSLKHADGSGKGLTGIQFQWLDGLKWKSLGGATYKKTDGSTNWSFLVTGQVFPPKPIKLTF